MRADQRNGPETREIIQVMRRMLFQITYLLPIGGALTYMLISGTSLGIVDLLTFAGTFATVWIGLDFITVKTGQPREELSPDEAA